MFIKKPKGTNDIFSENLQNFKYIEEKIHRFTKKFGIEEIRTPIFEYSELFKKSIGNDSDIVKKEMYNILSQGQDEFTLKPEGTAPIVRAYIENSLYSNSAPCKLYYISPCFRAERPQKGRLRQFHQFGIEYFGASSVESDCEVISALWLFLEELGIKNIKLKINSIGSIECRAEYNKVLTSFLKENSDNLCILCNERLKTNPMRALDCKNPSCINILENAPIILDFLNPESLQEFEYLQQNLNNLDIPFEIDSRIVRGLDYYNNTVFEVISSDLGGQSAIAGGGRYDSLIELHNGPKTPAIGFGLGIERLILIMQAQSKFINNDKKINVYIGSFDNKSNQIASKLAYKLRKINISAISDIMQRSVKSQMKYADKINSEYSFFIGETEIKENFVYIKNMETGDKISISFDKILDFFGGIYG